MPTVLNRVLLMLAVCNEVANADICRDELCNTDCASSGLYPDTGAVAKPGVCYRCWQTGYGGNCPDADHRDDGYTYDDCCNEKQCHTCGNPPPAPPPPDPCPCCFEAEPSLTGTGARAGDGKCFYCYETGYGGNCPDADHRDDGNFYDHCCYERSTVSQQCPYNDRAPGSAYCLNEENLGFDANGFVDDIGDGVGDIIDGIGDGVGDIIDGIGDGVGDIIDGIGDGVGDIVVGELGMFGPNCHVDSCTAVCTLGFKGVELRLEVDVEGKNEGTFGAFLNDASVLSKSIDGELTCFTLPASVTSIDNYQVCAKPTTDQEGGGGLVLSKSVNVEASLRARLGYGELSVSSPEYSFGAYTFDWKCPNIPVIVGVAVGGLVGAVILLLLMRWLVLVMYFGFNK